jgi:hypothetical protein
MMHVSNRHMDFASVVAGIAHAERAGQPTQQPLRARGARTIRTTVHLDVVISAREDADFGRCARTPTGRDRAAAGQRIWTDDYSNVIGRIGIRKASIAEPEPSPAAQPAPHAEPDRTGKA